MSDYTMFCCVWFVRSHPAARVAITEAANDDDDQYEDVVEDSGAMSGMIESASSLNGQAVANDAACDLSMIMEQSYMDADFDLCLSGMSSYPPDVCACLTVGESARCSDYCSTSLHI